MAVSDRATLLASLEDALAVASASDTPVSLLFLNPNDFIEINQEKE